MNQAWEATSQEMPPLDPHPLSEYVAWAGSILMSLVSDVLGVKKVRIDYKEEGNKRELVIPGIAQAEIESIKDIRGGDATIDNPPLYVVTSHPAVVAKSSHYEYHDYDKNRKFGNRNGFYSAFNYRP
jgi:hypothetical protein